MTAVPLSPLDVVFLRAVKDAPHPGAPWALLARELEKKGYGVADLKEAMSRSDLTYRTVERWVKDGSASVRVILLTDEGSKALERSGR